MQKIGRKVLERADEIRSQISKNQYTPQWLKTVSSSLTVPGFKRAGSDSDGATPAGPTEAAHATAHAETAHADQTLSAKAEHAAAAARSLAGKAPPAFPIPRRRPR